MADRKFKNRTSIDISSSSSSSEQSESVQESDGDISGENSLTSCDDDSDWSSSENEEEDKASVDKDDDESSYDKVIQFLQGRRDLQKLNLMECKVYLRRHCLRISGTKEECIERIKEHWRLKDGNGEAFYPRSSFTINCTGDVCKGDVVLFNQRVYESFDKMKRRGSLLGRRIVAGRVVKESYGAAKQQHTFTVEVLWSKGSNKLAPLFPLLVKGGNLYKMRTFRQRWKNERERLKVLDEKHERGAAARNLKAMRRMQTASNTSKFLAQKGSKRHKHSHPSGAKEQNNVKKNRLNEQRKSLDGNQKRNPRQSFRSFQGQNSKQNEDFKHHTSHWNHQDHIQTNQVRQPPFHPSNKRHRNSYGRNPGFTQRGLRHFPSHRDSASSSASFPYFNPVPNSYFTPYSGSQDISHTGPIHNARTHFSDVSESRIFDDFPRRMNISTHHFTTDTNRRR